MFTLKKISMLAAAGLLVLPAFAAQVAAAPVGSATFSGIVDHVSTNNIKVTNTKSNETLSFLIVPKFDQVFSGDGKTTYQMSAVKAGRYVKIYYDQKALGQRHADRILLLDQANAVTGRQ